MKVNMTPNPLDVVTIHASQGDTEARQWEFELHNNGELIDTSNVKEQLVFKAYKGGTEQLLPENTSTPTTSPFKGDIKYPKGLLTDQEFTYRQSPTEEDGLAKITDIKGNTLVWNQLIGKGNMTDGWTFSNTTGSYSNKVLTFTATAKNGFVRPDRPQYIYADHKYFATVDVKATSAFTGRIYFTGRNEGFILDPNYTTSWKTFSLVFTNTVTEYNYYPRVFDVRDSGWDAIQIRNCMLFDLTQMGLDITSPSEFTSLFPLSYYSYNQGSLLSFNGNGIKTVGFNQWDEEWENGAFNNNTGEKIVNANRIRSKNIIRVIPNETYYFKAPNNAQAYYFDGNMNYIGLAYDLLANRTFVVPSNMVYMYIAMATAYGNTYRNDVCVNLSSDENGEYEPYTSSTLSLPISTYFPTGMKSAGNVYDELTESKAISRIGAVDLGSLAWGRSGTGHFFASLSGAVSYGADAMPNVLCEKYNPTTFNKIQAKSDVGITIYGDNVRVYDNSYSSYGEFQTAMQGVYLYYELATPTETSFTTASLVTENAEIPLSNEDGVLIGKCTEELSAEPGFHDAKIKLSDSDGTCYSNKLQLHVERSPQ